MRRLGGLILAGAESLPTCTVGPDYTQRTLFQLQQQLASSEGRRVQNLGGLYRALGGGWVVRASDATMPARLREDADAERLSSIRPSHDGD